MRFNKKPLDHKFIKKWTMLKVNQIVLSILYRRGLTKDLDLIDYIDPIFENIIQPFEFTFIDKAFERLSTAIINKERILIFGDRDVDGTSSVAILYDFLKGYTDNIFWEVPTGEDIYGLDIAKFGKWKELGYSLCITVDCGITNVNEINLLKKYNIDTIVIDHHKPLEVIPDAVSIINPKCENSFLFSDIAACGVVFLFIYGFLIYKSNIYNKKISVIYYDNNCFKLDTYVNFVLHDRQILKNTDLQSTKDNLIFSYTDKVVLDNIPLLQNSFDKNNFISSLDDISQQAKISLFNKIQKEIDGLEKIKELYLPIVMLGLIADIMPMVKTNRTLIKLGIKYLKNNKNKNLTVLLKKINIDTDLCISKDFAWNICPILNASGRMGKASATVDFFIAKSDVESKVASMITNNEDRKRVGEEAFNIFKNDIESNKKHYNDNLIFFYSEKISRGITGITANKISNQINCPVIVCAKEGIYYTGSMRGKSSMHLVDFLNNAKDILEEFGGHKEAAGFRFREEKLSNFECFLKENSKLLETKKEDVLSNTIEIDAEIPYEYLNLDLFKILEILEPQGEANPTPIFFTEKLYANTYLRMGKNRQHLKIYFKTKNGQIPAIFWNRGEWFENIHNPQNSYNIIYSIELNKFNDQVIPQLNLIDLEISGE